MGLSKKILNFALGLVNALTFWIKPQKNRITFVSLTQDHLDADFALLNEQLQRENKYDIHYNLIVYRNNLAGSAKYFFNCLKQLVEYKKSALAIINDNNYVLCNFKPDHLQVLQVWHACGAVKKFGNQIKRQYPIRGYNAVLASADYWKPVYAQAFGVDQSAVKPTGLPRIDNLLNKERMDRLVKDFFARYPQLQDKKLILYAPTFRGNIIDGLQTDTFDMAQVLDALDQNTYILYKLHPLLPVMASPHERAIDVSKEDLYMLMQASSGMISDYSSVIFDYSLLDKPMYSYLDDLEQYSAKIGLNIDYKKEFPGPICFDEQSLIQALQQDQDYQQKRQAFQEKFITNKDGKNTQRVIKIIDALVK